MAWTQPKTNWKNGEYFNLTPDYDRIKGNIEYLIQLAEELYLPFPHPTLSAYTISQYPQKSFFNNVVEATKAIIDYGYNPSGSKLMPTYESNGEAWSAQELNAIENNHLLLYEAFTGQIECLRTIEFTLGGTRFS